MDWEVELISLYLYVCKHFQNKLMHYCTRMTRYADLRFSDEEVLMLYLYGVMEGHRSMKAIHRYARRHLQAWFPNMPNYGAFDHRVNQLHDTFVPLTELLCNELGKQVNRGPITGLTDSMPVILAHRGRRFKAKVAPELATSNRYCATKKLYYYGVKLHVVASHQRGTLPVSVCLGVTDAGLHDRKVFEQIIPFLPENMRECYADKAYQVEDEPVHQEAHVTLMTPVKKKKGQVFLDTVDQWLSTAISQVRQPVESLFNWIHEKTGIQIASKVRS